MPVDLVRSCDHPMKGMKAARMHRYGGNEVVVVEEVRMPTPGPGEVLIRIEAAGVNPVDWKIREGYMSKVLPVTFPYTFGCEIAGVVEGVGDGVTRFRDGDLVFGYPDLMRAGAFAERIVMREDEIALAPASIPLADAAALPVAVITAYDGLFTHGRLEAPQRVLVLGGSGGVGSAAVQLAVSRGAEVYATASARNQEWLSEMGATPIDYGSQETMDVARDVDLIFDTVGVESATQALPSLKFGGTFVSSVYALPSQEALESRHARASVYGISPSAKRLSEVAEIVDRGGVKMNIDQVFPLDRVSAALDASKAGRTRGKLLIRPTNFN
jgi:NADPH:quinone reductase-like Zn-dependent oxidoreductase